MKKIFSLTHLNLQNFATFKNQVVEFDSSLNVIVGETGSGKSLILEAIQFIFGNRADKKLIRKGSEQACVEAIFQFNSSNVYEYFDSLGFPVFENEIILKRVLYSNGKSKVFINNQSAKTSDLNSVCKRFIDLVGQFENQKLLQSSYQIKLLDQYANINPLVSQYSHQYSELQTKQNELIHLQQKINHTIERVDYLEFQINQIKSINPKINEDEELINLKNKILNHEKRASLIKEYSNILFSEDSDSGIINQLNFLCKNLSKNQSLVPEIYFTEHDAENILQKLNDVYSNCLKIMNQDIPEFDIDAIFNRLDQLQKLKTKFGPTLQDVLAKQNSFETELEQLQATTISLSSLEKQIESLKAKLIIQAKEIHDIRVRFASKLSIELTQAINQLKMTGAKFVVKIEELPELNPTGMSQLQYLAETNPGEGVFPITEIASGGELSRILLAIRQILSSKDTISIFFFDEIDSGIGGETALSIADALKNVSLSSQVVAISHLPQIAAKAQMLQVVSKHTDDDHDQIRTFSEVSYVKGVKIVEYAKSMSPIQ
jgi:DNA repair protein RecN (Recombination protein N)